MNRRTALLGALASTLPVAALAKTDEVLVLERLITEVIAAGTTTAGQTVDDPGFYAARVVDGLIAELYIGQ